MKRKEAIQINELTDLISRENAIDAVKKEIQDFEANYMHGEDDKEYGHDIGFVAGLHRAKMFIRSLPSAEAVQPKDEWKYIEKDGNPKEMGTYYCLVVAPTEYNGKTIPYYEYDLRWFGEGETAQAWKMDGQPDSGLVWTEQTGSMQGEQVYAWRELPDMSNCLVDPQAFERLCKIK